MAVFPLPKWAHPDFRIPGKKPVGVVEVDWSNPLTDGLVHLYLMGSDGVIAIDLVGDLHLDTPVNMGAAGTAKGVAADYSTAGSYLRHSSQSVDVFGGYPFTVTAHVDLSAVTASGAFICNNDFSASANWGFVLEYHTDSDSFRGMVRNTSGYIPADGPALGAGKGLHIGSFVARSSTNRQVFVDGVGGPLATGSVPYPSGVDALSTGELARSNDWTNGDPYSGKILLIALHNRDLTDLELDSFHRNPYQILKPANPLFVFTDEGAAPPAGNIAPLSHHHRFHNMAG